MNIDNLNNEQFRKRLLSFIVQNEPVYITEVRALVFGKLNRQNDQLEYQELEIRLARGLEMLREAGAIETYELVDDEPYKFNSPLIDSPPFLLITANKGLMPLPLVAPSLLEEGEINKRVVVDKVKTISERLKEIKFKGARSNEKAIEKMLQAITQRRGQAAFRQNLLDTYKRCLVTGCEAVDALEAAHIRPYAGGGTFALSNGLLLRADIHTLFDLGLIAVDSEDMTVIILPPLEGTEYELYDGETLKFSEGTAGIPDVEALDEHLGTAVLNWKN